MHNYLLESSTLQAEKTLEELKELTVEVNRGRKNEQVSTGEDIGYFGRFNIHITQTRIGNQLTLLETRWTELISSVLQIEMANIALDAEVERLNRREEELADL